MTAAALVGFQCVFDDDETKPLVDCVTANEMNVIINRDTDQSAYNNGQFVFIKWQQSSRIFDFSFVIS